MRTGRENTTVGFSLIELMIGMSVLAVGMLGGMAVICVATASNGGSKLNTTAATLAESTMERIMAIPQGATGNAALTSVTDCKGNNLVMDTSGDPVSGSGAPLISAGAFGTAVDYTQPAVPNYAMLYAMCSRGGQELTYDVRWRIDPGPTPSTQLVTVSVKSLASAGNPAAGLARRITLHSLRGN